ncbi:hypothetical protein [Ramlibacter tataouinensis]|uniref:Uncharacterized protein n=1 Tax=Ramlibacter tataouinensis TaxID=94132 RepID=A0A127JWS9_9BURK|nr:hypothetical protein [Ramlibacter tataouinensis]AMO24355.1 hypothetical protein UC35_17755 [Ramlibacter tataouinensis]
MPFGIVGSFAVAVLVPLAVCLAYVFAWPGVEGRRALFLAVAVVSAIALGVVSFWWHLRPLQGVALSGEAVPGSQPWSSFEADLQVRYFLSVAAAFIVQVVACVGLDHLLRGNG